MQIPRPQTRQGPSPLWLRPQSTPQPLGAGCWARSSAVEKFGCCLQREHRKNAQLPHDTAESTIGRLQWPHVFPLNVAPSTGRHLCLAPQNMMGIILNEAAT